MSTKFGIVYQAALKIGYTTFVSADMCFICGVPQNKLFGVIREWVRPSTFEWRIHVSFFSVYGSFSFYIFLFGVHLPTYPTHYNFSLFSHKYYLEKRNDISYQWYHGRVTRLVCDEPTKILTWLIICILLSQKLKCITIYKYYVKIMQW